jgi:putative MATE family efflux protein
MLVIGVEIDQKRAGMRQSPQKSRPETSQTGVEVDASAPNVPSAADARSARTRALLEAPIVSTLAKLSWPNILVSLAQASTGLVETWWVSRLGTDALAGMAVVFPTVMLMQMMSQGAMGGGIASAIARALGAGRRDAADALVLHAIVINVVAGAFFTVLVLAFGPQLYELLGGRGASLDAALAYSNVVFSGVILLWVMNGLASVIRGTGNMFVPGLVICGGAVLLIPLSPLLIFGIGPIPRLGIVGGGVALLIYYVGALAIFAWYILSGRNGVRLKWVRLRWASFREILRVGVLATITSLQTNLTIALTTALVGSWSGPASVAGYGTGARLEYLLSPLAFGIGGSLVAMVGMNVGAGQMSRALRIAFTGGAGAFVITETIGVAAAIWPEAWLRLFDSDPSMLASGSAYLRMVGPFYGFYGLGFALYFASQGAGQLLWPLLAGFFRLFIAVGGGWLALYLTGSLWWMFSAIALGLLVYGLIIVVSIARGGWGSRLGQSRRAPS